MSLWACLSHLWFQFVWGDSHLCKKLSQLHLVDTTVAWNHLLTSLVHIQSACCEEEGCQGKEEGRKEVRGRRKGVKGRRKGVKERRKGVKGRGELGEGIQGEVGRESGRREGLVQLDRFTFTLESLSVKTPEKRATV